MSTFTPNYELIQFETNDEPSWLGAWNDTMSTIDTALATIASNITGIVTNVSDAKVAADQAAASAETAQLAADAAKGVATNANTNAAAALGQSQLLMGRSGDVYFPSTNGLRAGTAITGPYTVTEEGFYLYRSYYKPSTEASNSIRVNNYEVDFCYASANQYINTTGALWLNKGDVITATYYDNMYLFKITPKFNLAGKYNYPEVAS